MKPHRNQPQCHGGLVVGDPERGRRGPHDLVADTRLEDLAGNSIAQPFEVDVLRPVERQIKTETVKVPFCV